MRTRDWASRLSRPVAAAVGLLLVAAILPSPIDAAAVPVKYHGSRTKPYIALTIDDGYATANCKALADILKVRNVPATYFPYSRVVTNNPTAWRHISAEGFPIADHTVSHPDLTTLSYSGQLWQIKTAKSRIQNVIGKAIAPLLRPPYGAWNYNTRVAAGAAGLKYLVLWDTSFADTTTMSDTRHFNHAMRGTNGSIILCHCGPASTVRIMPKVIAAYRARGLKFVTVEQLLGLKPIGATLTSLPGPTPTPTPTAASTLEPQAPTDPPEAIIARRFELHAPPTLTT
jgi:peptidoglycan/xylan/chitin deacetylase (PgdA/CDA1 family)